jgi:hypothetical protein
MMALIAQAKLLTLGNNPRGLGQMSRSADDEPCNGAESVQCEAVVSGHGWTYLPDRRRGTEPKTIRSVVKF